MQTAIEVFHPERILSASNKEKLLSWVEDCLASDYKILVIDFKYVLFMDSTGLSALVMAQNQIKQANGQLVLCSVGGQAKMLLEMTNTDRLFELYSSQSEFLNTIQNEE